MGIALKLPMTWSIFLIEERKDGKIMGLSGNEVANNVDNSVGGTPQDKHDSVAEDGSVKDQKD